MMSTSFSLLLLGWVLVQQPAGAQPSADFVAKAEAIVQSWVAEDLFRGSVMVAKSGQPLLRKGYGLANSEWQIGNTPDTKFRIGSITKQFTAISILQLMEQGKLKLDDPVSKHYPSAPATWEKITIHHLLNHTSGIPSYTGIKDFFAKKSRDPLKPAEIVKLTQDQPLDFEPGSQYRYNNSAYVLLGHIVESLSGMTYAEYVRKNILDPAGMKDTGYDTHAEVLSKRATGYSPTGENAPYLDMTLPHAAGSLYSTVDDFVKWDRALNEGKLLSKDSWKLMTTAGKSDYGYGLQIRKVAGHASQGHGGGINGFNTHFLRFPEDGVAVAVFANVNGPAADQLANMLARLYFGEDVKPRQLKKEIPVSAKELDACSGSYQVMPAATLKVWREGTGMKMQMGNQPALSAAAYERGKYFVRGMDVQLECKGGEEGTVDSVVLHQNARQMPGKRVAGK